jgi:c-di-GMP-binding flagellar brake protein YcgR
MNIPTDAGEMETAEKRRYSRIELRQPIQFQSTNCALEGGSLSCDLSEGGVRVDMYDFLPLGTELTMRICLAVEKIVEYVGRVVWVRKYPFADRYRVGLEFSGDKTFLAAKRQLHEFIEVQ